MPTARAQLVAQVTQLYADVRQARKEGNFEKVNLLERLAPRFEIAIGPLCRCETCLNA